MNDSQKEKNPQLNVLSQELKACCHQPQTGFYRDGFCKTDATDHGSHTVCALITQEFLDFSRQVGNDLSTPREALLFPGLKPGDKWCVCAGRWVQALEHGVAPPIYLESTHIKALERVPLEDLQKNAVH